jgi:hypothetical protein
VRRAQGALCRAARWPSAPPTGRRENQCRASRRCTPRMGIAPKAALVSRCRERLCFNGRSERSPRRTAVCCRVSWGSDARLLRAGAAGPCQSDWCRKMSFVRMPRTCAPPPPPAPPYAEHGERRYVRARSVCICDALRRSNLRCGVRCAAATHAYCMEAERHSRRAHVGLAAFRLLADRRVLCRAVRAALRASAPLCARACVYGRIGLCARRCGGRCASIS